jgi:hypothetical protein
MISTRFRSLSLLAQRGLSLLVFVLVLVMVLAMLPKLPPPPAAAQGTPLEVEFGHDPTTLSPTAIAFDKRTTMLFLAFLPYNSRFSGDEQGLQDAPQRDQ